MKNPGLRGYRREGGPHACMIYELEITERSRYIQSTNLIIIIVAIKLYALAK